MLFDIPSLFEINGAMDLVIYELYEYRTWFPCYNLTQIYKLYLFLPLLNNYKFYNLGFFIYIIYNLN